MSDRKSWSDRWFQLFLAFVVALVVAVCGPLVLSWAAPRFEAVFREPTCDDPRGLVPVSVKAPTVAIPASASAEDTSSLDGYPPEKMIDADTATAWVEGVRSGPASTNLGQKISITFTLPGAGSDLQMICIVNGYAKSWAVFQANASIRLMTVSTDAGKPLVSGLAAKRQSDYAAFESLEFTHGQTTKVTLKIDSARAGSGDGVLKRKFEDLAVSEIEFWVRK